MGKHDTGSSALMAADTKDVPAKGPQKGFSLRSRLLGLPTGEQQSATASITAALQPRDEPTTDTPVSEDAPEIVAQPVDDVVETKSYEAPSASVKPAPIIVPNDDDDDGDENEEPRVGLALPRRTSLLSAALGFGERKVKAEAPKIAAEPVAPPAPVVEHARQPGGEPRAAGRAIL